MKLPLMVLVCILVSRARARVAGSLKWPRLMKSEKLNFEFGCRQISEQIMSSGQTQ